MARIKLGFILVLILGTILFFSLVPGVVDQKMNRVDDTHIQPLSDAARRLHQSLLVADLHNDVLLWNRDLVNRHSRGHSDIPRLLDGKVGIQVFSAVTKTPRGLNYERNAADSDMLTPLLIAQRWPPRTWTNLTERALYQSEKLHRAAATSDAFTLLKNKSDLTAYLAARTRNTNQLAGLLALEGLHALEGDVVNLNRLYLAGYRIMGLTHFFDNAVAGSAHGLEKGGLTPLGRQVVQQMEHLGITVDLAHASAQTVADVLALATRPVVVSHTGVAGTCPGPRNLTDDQIRRIARQGGLIGIGVWEGAVCDINPESIAQAIRHAVDVAGIAHVALGTDFDGATTTAFDAAHLAQLTQALLKAGFTPLEVRRIMGGNILQFLQQALPETTTF